MTQNRTSARARAARHRDRIHTVAVVLATVAFVVVVGLLGWWLIHAGS